MYESDKKECSKNEQGHAATYMDNLDQPMVPYVLFLYSKCKIVY